MKKAATLSITALVVIYLPKFLIYWYFGSTPRPEEFVGPNILSEISLLVIAGPAIEELIHRYSFFTLTMIVLLLVAMIVKKFSQDNQPAVNRRKSFTWLLYIFLKGVHVTGITADKKNWITGLTSFPS